MGASEESEALTLLAMEVQAQPRQGVFLSTAPFTWAGLTLVPNLAGGWVPGGRNTGCSSRDASPSSVSATTCGPGTPRLSPFINQEG